MELQKIFSTDYFNELKSQVKRGINLERYQNGEFEIDKTQLHSLMGIYHPDKNVFKLEADKDNDFENAVRLFECYKDLSPMVASSEVFWAYLTHFEFFDFCIQRWPDVKNKNIPEIPKDYVYTMSRNDSDEIRAANEYIGYILTHWFFNAGGRFRNALAGLWWPVYVTYDDERKNKYELTEILFSHADIRATAYASTLFRHKSAITAILEFYLEHKEIRDSAWQWRNRYIFHYLNRYGGVTNLFYLNKKFFKDELERNLDTLMNVTCKADVSNRSELIWK